MKTRFKILFLMILISSCKKTESVKSTYDEFIVDTTITLSKKNNFTESDQEFSEKEAEKTLYEYFKKKGILSQSFVKSNLSELEKQLFVDYDTIYRFPSKKSLAIITYWLAPAYLNGHCVQPKRAIISRFEKELKITNEEFIPERFLIDSIDKKSTIFISDYECANDTILKKYRLKFK